MMTIRLDDPKIESIFINDFKSDIEAFTQYIKSNLLNKQENIEHLNPFENSYKIEFDSRYIINEEDNPFKDIRDSLEYAKELREKAWR